MTTAYHPFKIALSDGQKAKLQHAFASRSSVTLRVKPGDIGRGDELLLTATQINHMKKANSERKGADLNLFSTVLGLARPLIKPALGALASTGLSFGVEKILKKIFGKGYGPQEIKLYELAKMLTPAQKKGVENYLVGKGMVRGGGVAQYGGFLGMLASIGVPLAIELVKKLVGKGLQVKPAPSRTRRSPAPPPAGGKGMQINPHPLSLELGMI